MSKRRNVRGQIVQAPQCPGRMSGDEVSKRRSVRHSIVSKQVSQKIDLLGRLYYSIVLSSEISGEVCLFMCVDSLDQIIQD